jgi:hypothetical protein
LEIVARDVYLDDGARERTVIEPKIFRLTLQLAAPREERCALVHLDHARTECRSLECSPFMRRCAVATCRTCSQTPRRTRGFPHPDDLEPELCHVAGARALVGAASV